MPLSCSELLQNYSRATVNTNEKKNLRRARLHSVSRAAPAKEGFDVVSNNENNRQQQESVQHTEDAHLHICMIIVISLFLCICSMNYFLFIHFSFFSQCMCSVAEVGVESSALFPNSLVYFIIYSVIYTVILYMKRH